MYYETEHHVCVFLLSTATYLRSKAEEGRLRSNTAHSDEDVRKHKEITSLKISYTFYLLQMNKCRY